MITVPLTEYTDEDRNTIVTSHEMDSAQITFRGKNNTLTIRDGARFGRLIVGFDGDNGNVTIESNGRVSPSSWTIRVGEDSSVVIGQNVSATNICVISAVEGTSVQIGDDCMLASGIQIRADDAHAIYDVKSGNRVNVSKSISVGRHVWLGFESVLLPGAQIGEGSVTGFRSIVTGKIPNNVVAVGSPARVVRKNIAWERPHLSLSKPAYRPNASVIKKTEDWWNLTREPSDVDLNQDPMHVQRRSFMQRLGLRP